MSNQYNIYCDESCHLEKDKQKAMVLGCIVLPCDMVKTVSDEIKAIKKKKNWVKPFRNRTGNPQKSYW
ncbi:DUF3800 domain-containing protein [Candidatus Poribacteria bacterium]|nr:DUF3800 domain-containing protein [Candidatus Poribacteria bacterium]